jgi:hypothetical protein
MVRAQFTPIYTGYYLQLMEQKLRHKGEAGAEAQGSDGSAHAASGTGYFIRLSLC